MERLPAEKPRHKSPKPDTPPTRIRVAADNEFLLMPALELEPVARSPGDVGAIAILGDNTLPAAPACSPKIGLAVPLTMLGKLQRIPKLESAAQYFFSVLKRDP